MTKRRFKDEFKRVAVAVWRRAVGCRPRWRPSWDHADDATSLAAQVAGEQRLARKIVGWAMRDHLRTELPLAALMMVAQRQRPVAGLICHSDRGSQYAASAHVDHPATIGPTPSMSRTGNCCDNAPMESFFHALKVELVRQCRWATQAEARQALFG